MPAKIIVTRKSVILTVLGFLFVMAFRFFLGRPMNGKKNDNSTFLRGATKGRPGKVLTEWQKRPHIHRALIRNSVFWPIIMLFVLATVSRTAVLLVLAFSAFPVGLYAFRKGRLVFFSPFVITDAVTGNRTQQWQMKNKYRKLLHRRTIPGVVKRRERFDPQLSVEVQEAIAAELNNNPKGVQTVFPPKITRYRRTSGKRSDR